MPLRDSLVATLRRHWFLFALLILIPGGVALGAGVGERVTEVTRAVEPRWITAIALFLMSLSLDSSQLGKSLRSPGPVLLASAINMGVIPLMALALAPLQLTRDFRYGLIVAASVPCTMAAASVWTRQARGNDAVSLLVTLLTNSTCVLVTPFWLRLGTGAEVELGFSAMATRLLMAVLLPGIFGQALRQIEPVRRFAVRRKPAISVAAMVCILSLVLASSCECGLQLGGHQTPGVPAVVLVWTCCIGLHLIAMLIGVAASRMFGISAFDEPAVAFASSQKTLPIGVLLSRELASVAGVPFTVFPMLMFHASQLLIDTAIAGRMARRRQESETG